MILKNIKITFCLSFMLLLKSVTSVADEGMWPVFLLQQLNMKSIQEKGLELTPEQLYNINNLSLKDAIVAINKGSCTGSIVSPNGLMITNHHCSVGQVQNHSTVEKNYLKEGFWASGLSEELPNPGMTVSFLVDVKDVTGFADSLIQDQLKKGREYPNMMKVFHTIKRDASKNTKYDVQVHSMFERNKYYVFYYKTYKDVRLVGIPPKSIGNFGGETDNWMWPRHTADFAVFRVYTSPEGEPREYHPDNVPLKAEKYLKISLEKQKKNDFAMVLGYPGKTKRSLTSYGTEELQNVINPIRILFRTKKLDLVRKEMNTNETYALNHSDIFAVASNYWKMSKGQNESLRKWNVIERKKSQEQKITRALQENPDALKSYTHALKTIENAYSEKKSLTRAIHYYNEAILFGPEIFKMAIRMRRMEIYLERLSNKPKKIEKAANALLEDYKKLYQKFDAELDRRIYFSMMKPFKREIDSAFLPAGTVQMLKGPIERMADSSYNHSIFKNYASIEGFLADPDLETLRSDFMYRLASSLYNQLIKMNRNENNFENRIEKSSTTIYDILLDYVPQYANYPDANSTMRLTYGDVGGYEPADGIWYTYFTTSGGLLEKHATGKREYEIPDQLKSLFEAQDFGGYAHGKEDLSLCFLTDLDITGGNSGSPVLNGEGELTGLAFDGNWEGLAGDVEYIPGKTNCICTDINYVLFVIDKFADCQHIMRELDVDK